MDKWFPLLAPKHAPKHQKQSPTGAVFQEQLPGVFCEKGVLTNFAKFTGKNLCQGLFFNKAAGTCNFIKKEALALVFSCEFCEISKNTLFYRTPLVVAPETRPLRAEWYKVLRIIHCGISPTEYI